MFELFEKMTIGHFDTRPGWSGEGRTKISHQTNERGPRIAWNCTVRGRWITVESWVAGSKNEGDRSGRRRGRNLERWQRRRRGVGSRHPKKSIMSLLCTACPDKSNEKYSHACSASLACACHDGLCRVLILPFRFPYTSSCESIDLYSTYEGYR